MVRSVTITESTWSNADRGLVLALLAEQRDTCPACGHLMSECRDRKTSGTWQAVEEVCWPSVVSQVAAENVRDSKRRGVMVGTRRTPGIGRE